MQHTASEIIEALGGTSAVARELEIAPTTVSSWKTSETIPPWRWPAIEDIAKRRGLSFERPQAAA